MGLLKNIFARIWALWGLISFIITFIIIFIPSMCSWLLPDPAGQRLFYYVSRVWMEVWLRMVGCPLSVKGKSFFKKGETYIVTSNHNSLMDVPVTSPFIPGANKTIAKSSFKKVPLFGFFYAKGSVLVDRKSDASRKASFGKMKAALRMGYHMCIYPEGTRNRGSEPLKKFHDGAFRLAIETGNSIIPAVLFNTKEALPTNKPFYFLPKKLRMEFLEPVSPSGKSVGQLRDEVFQKMSEYYLLRK